MFLLAWSILKSESPIALALLARRRMGGKETGGTFIAIYRSRYNRIQLAPSALDRVPKSGMVNH